MSLCVPPNDVLCDQGDDAAPQRDDPEGDSGRGHCGAAVEGRGGEAGHTRHPRGKPRVRGQRQILDGRAHREGECNRKSVESILYN